MIAPFAMIADSEFFQSSIFILQSSHWTKLSKCTSKKLEHVLLMNSFFIPIVHIHKYNVSFHRMTQNKRCNIKFLCCFQAMAKLVCFHQSIFNYSFFLFSGSNIHFYYVVCVLPAAFKISIGNI